MLTPHRARVAIRLAALTAQAWVGLAVFDLAMVSGFAHVHERVRRSMVRARAPARRLSPGDVVWAVDEACVWYVKRAACLQRSVVATRLLRRHGVHADLVIGYRPIPFESHAWVEVEGRVVNDRQQYQKFFAVLERL
jgi:hypothetical protein